MAERLGIERESVYRLEKRVERVTAEQQAIYADELRIEPEALWKPPGNLPTMKLHEGKIKKLSKKDIARIVDEVVRRIPTEDE